MGGSNSDARVTVGVDGADEVARAADRALRPWTNAAQTAKTAVQGVGAAFADTVRQTASDVARGVTAFAAFDLSSRIPAVIQYREEVARLAVVGGQSSDALRDKFAKQEAQTLQSRQANEDFAKSFGRVTYNYREAADAASHLSAEALASNRSLGEIAPVGKLIYDATQKMESMPDVLGRIRAQAERVGTIGGPDALRDQFEQLGGVIARMATQSPEQLGRFAGAVAAIGKGLRPEQAKEAQQSIMSKVFGDTRATERFLRSQGELKKGESIVDEHGQIKDAGATLAAYQRAWRKGAGSDREADRLARMYFGDMGGAAFRSAKLGGDAGTSTGAQDAAAQLLASPEGKRKAAQLAARGAQDSLVEPVLPAVDATLGFTKDHPMLAAAGALFGPGMVDKAISGGLGAGGGLLGAMLGLKKAGLIGGAAAKAAAAAGSAGAVGAGGTSTAGGLLAAAEGGWLTGAPGTLLSGGGALAAGAAPGVGAALALGQLAAVGKLLGEDTATTGRKWREEHGGVEVLEAYQRARRAEMQQPEDMPMEIIAARAEQNALGAGASKEDAAVIGQLIAKEFGVSAKVQVTIVNQTGGPIQALNEQGADPSGQQ